MTQAYSDRQRREIEYHRDHAERHKERALVEPDMDVITDKKRRWWNAYWSTYDLLIAKELNGKKVLVVGCGFGEDALRIARLGAEVHAFDISPEVIEVAKRRAEKFCDGSIHFDVMASESLNYPDDFFDLIYCIDILHHVDIPKTVLEFQRVVKDGGSLTGDELYTHSWLQKIRESYLLDKVLYPKMRKFIYQDSTPYITEDEHKIDEPEFAVIKSILERPSLKYFNFAVGRLVPDKYAIVARLDRFVMILLMGLGRFLAGRVVFDGKIKKQ